MDTEGTKINHKERVRSQFGQTAADYVSSPGHRSGRDLDQIVELARATGEEDALDIATGGGHTALAIAPHVRSVVASDLTPKMLDAARGFILEQGITNASFEIADAEALPFADASFDIVTCRIAPHHFSDVQAFCNEVARVLRPGGRFVLMDSISPEEPDLDAFINELEWRRDTTHVRSYNLAEWRTFIENADLKVEAIELVNRTHDYPTWTARSRMTEDAKSDLDAWILSQPEATLDYFEIMIDGSDIQSFADHKAIIQSVKAGAEA
jgi:ubiquinone/menaquinone biosynthesis C-methylase UbiE